MRRRFQVEGAIQSINIYQEPAWSQGLVVGAGDTQMALASEEVTDKGDRCIDSHQCCDQKEQVHRVRGVRGREFQGLILRPKVPGENPAEQLLTD